MRSFTNDTWDPVSTSALPSPVFKHIAHMFQKVEEMVHASIAQA